MSDTNAAQPKTTEGNLLGDDWGAFTSVPAKPAAAGNDYSL